MYQYIILVILLSICMSSIVSVVVVASGSCD